LCLGGAIFATAAGCGEDVQDTPLVTDSGPAPECLADSDCLAVQRPCAAARCDAGVCIALDLDQGACDDGNPCTVGDACQGGVCNSGSNLCQCAGQGDCANKNDGNLCNGVLYCDLSQVPHVCIVNPASFVYCNQTGSTQCANNACDPNTGECGPIARPDGTTCNDGDPCTVESACQNGKCQSGKATHCQCDSDSDCPDDGDPCNGTLFCDLSIFPYSCQTNPATVVNCAKNKDTNCLKNACESATGKCHMQAVEEGTPCDDDDATTANDACQLGVCVGGVNVAKCAVDSDCPDDGDLCNGLPYCDKATATCVINPATLITCPSVSDKACIKNTCVPSTGQCAMSPTATLTPCDDKDTCTKGDFCLAGACKGGEFTCKCASDLECDGKEDGNQCNGTLFCNLASGKCTVNPSKVVICKTVDDTDCKKNACVPLSGACTMTDAASVKAIDCGSGVDAQPGDKCRHEVKPAGEPLAKNLPCDDADKCTEGEVCANGSCGGGAFVCGCETDADCDEQEDGNLCNGTLFCNKALSPAICKHNPATTVTCPALFEKPCQTNKCLPKSGLCQPVPALEGKGCDDGSKCSAGDHCNAGLCVGMAKVTCDDSNACTSDNCDPLKGCQHGKANCDDGNACTLDQCDPKTGQCKLGTPVKDGAVCNGDNSGCTVNDACAVGVCKVGVPVSCSVPTGPCEKAICATTGPTSFACVKTPIGNGDACDDGLACTLGETCLGGLCKAGGKQALYERTLAPGKGLEGWFRAATELDDGGFAVIGTALSAPGESTATRIWMARLDTVGEVVWQDFAPLPGQASEAGGVGVVRTGGDKLAFIGNHAAKDGHLGMHFILRDLGGKKLDAKTVLSGGADETLAEAAAFPGGGAAVVGVRRVGAKSDALVRRLSPGGQVVWQVVVGGAGDEEARGVGVTAAGVTLVAGSNGSLVPGKTSAMLLRLGASGTKTWLHVYGNESQQAFEDVVWLASGGGVAAGWRLVSGIRRRWIVATDAKGGVIWEQKGDDGFVPRSLVVRAGDNLIMGGTAQAGAGSTNARLLASDAFGNLSWDLSPAVGGSGRALGLAGAGGGGLLAVGAAGAPGQRAGLLVRTDPWGRRSCKTAGKCAEIPLATCDDGNACTHDSCHAVAGCTAAILPGGFCASTDQCSKRGVCVSGKCGPSDEGKLYHNLIDAGALKEVLQVSADGDGAFIAARTTDGNVSLLRLDRYGTLQSKVAVNIADSKTVVGAVPVFDGGHVTAWLSKDGRVYAARFEPSGAQVWKTLVCAPYALYKKTGGYDVSEWKAWLPSCGLSELRAAPGGGRVIVGGVQSGYRGIAWVTSAWVDVKQCLWSRQLDIADGKLHPVTSGGHFCGGTQAKRNVKGGGPWSHGASHGNYPLSGRTIGLSDGGLLAFGTVSLRKASLKNTVKYATVSAGSAIGVARLSSLHSEIWVREITTAAEDRLSDVTQRDDGTYVGVGHRTTDGGQKDWMIALSAKGDLLWQRTGVIGSQARLRRVHVGMGSTLMVVADAVDQGAARLLYGVLEPTGSVLRQRAMGPLGLAAATAMLNPATRLPDFGMLIAGSVIQAGKAKVLVVRADPWGFDSCKAAGVCAAKSSKDCANGNPCSADLCDAKKGCETVNWSCDDGEVCTADACNAKTGCTHSLVTCDDKDACTVDVCVPGVGCSHTKAICSDDELCTADTCDKAKGCVYKPLDDGAACAKCKAGMICKSATCAVGNASLAATCGKKGNPARTCKDLLAVQPKAKDGSYMIDPDGTDGVPAWEALCDMEKGGWTQVNETTQYSYTSYGEGGKWHDYKYAISDAQIAALKSVSAAVWQGWACQTQHVGFNYLMKWRDSSTTPASPDGKCWHSNNNMQVSAEGKYVLFSQVPVRAWQSGDCSPSGEKCAHNVGPAWMR